WPITAASPSRSRLRGSGRGARSGSTNTTTARTHLPSSWPCSSGHGSVAQCCWPAHRCSSSCGGRAADSARRFRRIRGRRARASSTSAVSPDSCAARGKTRSRANVFGVTFALGSPRATASIRRHRLIASWRPPTAKTLLARTAARLIGGSFKRIQFTPGLMPSDIVGTSIFEIATSSFRIRLGPVFANVVLADEVNRAPAKTQAALLEAMEERQVTLEGEPHPLPDPFIVIATQNPVEYEGTYPLPEAELD